MRKNKIGGNQNRKLTYKKVRINRMYNIHNIIHERAISIIYDNLLMDKNWKQSRIIISDDFE